MHSAACLLTRFVHGKNETTVQRTFHKKCFDYLWVNRTSSAWLRGISREPPPFQVAAAPQTIPSGEREGLWLAMDRPKIGLP